MEFLQYSWITCAIVSLFSWDTLCAKSCPSVTIPNGHARIKGKGSYIEFKCKRNFQLVGAKIAICLPSLQWSQQIPFCVGTNCERPTIENNVIVESQYDGKVLKFSCRAGLTRLGPETIWCDGKNWSSQPPRCIEAVTIDCDFETSTFCGWSQDDTDDFDWTWSKGETPTANTGPRFDHTTNSPEGHYLFMESSAPQKTGQKTRLVSPPYVYSNTGTLCLELFYHMFGPDGIGEVGDLDIFIQPRVAGASWLTAETNVFHRSGNQGDAWIRADVEIPRQKDAFSIIVQGTRLKSWSGDIAIDDVRVYTCAKKSTISTEPANGDATTQSGVFNSQPADVTKKTTNRLSTITAIRKTKPSTPPLRTIITPTPPANTVSKAGAFTSGNQPSKPLLATTPVSSARGSTLSYNTVNRPTVTSSTFTMDTNKLRPSQTSVRRQTGMSSVPTLRSNVTSDDHAVHDNTKFTTSTTNYDTNNNYSDKNNNLKPITEEKSVFFTTPGYFDFDSNKTNTDSRSSENKSIGINESKTPYTDYMDANDGLMDYTGMRETSSSPGSVELIPLIVGVVASVVVGIIVTVIMACIWVRSKRTKQDKHQEDQMNIMSDYIETNLCT
ncbi:hypothetical protein BsWGS_19178 [Bradybaena similaris]